MNKNPSDVERFFNSVHVFSYRLVFSHEMLSNLIQTTHFYIFLKLKNEGFIRRNNDIAMMSFIGRIVFFLPVFEYMSRNINLHNSEQCSVF